MHRESTTKMFSKRILQIFCLALLNTFFHSRVIVKAGVTVEFKLMEFKNDKAKLFDGSYCEGIGGTCDTYFRLCVRLSSILNGLTNCDYTKSPSKYIEKNNINFQTDDTGIPKIISIKKDQWNGYIAMYLEAWDDDYIRDDRIDNFNYIRQYAASPNATRAEISETLYGTRTNDKTQLHFIVNIYCDLHYYGSKCNVFCQGRNDSIGHFRCNSKGERVCLSNWHNLPSCLTYCMPKDDDTYGHFVCATNGSRICRKNWHSLPDCKTYCEPHRDTVNGYYNCNTAGKKVCLPGWYGVNCTIFCQPRNSDTNGHYNCSETGNKVCLQHWYGPRCDTYCLPSGNNASGIIHCSDNGEKTCAPDYYGKNCTVFCLVLDKFASNYICDNRTGARVCRSGFSGIFCNISVSLASSAIPVTETIAFPIESSTDIFQSLSTVASPSIWTQHITSTVETGASPTYTSPVSTATMITYSSSISTTLFSQFSTLRSTNTFSSKSYINTKQYSKMLSSVISSSYANSARTTLSSRSSYLTIKTSLATHSASTAINELESTQLSKVLTPSLTSSSVAKHIQTSSSVAKHISTSSSVTKHIQTSSSVTKHIQTSSSVTKHIQTYSSVAKHISTSIGKIPLHSTGRSIASVYSYETRKVVISVTASSTKLSRGTVSKSSVLPTNGTAVPSIRPTDTNTSGSNQQSRRVDWLTETKEGKTVLFGSLFAFFLLLAVVVAVVMFVRSPKGVAVKKNVDDFDKFDSSIDEEKVFDNEEKSYFNPLYKIPIDVLTGQKKKKKEKLAKFYQKKDPSDNIVENEGNGHINMTYEEDADNVVINPLYAVRGQLVSNETEF